jgi:hypothetical protein
MGLRFRPAEIGAAVVAHCRDADSMTTKGLGPHSYSYTDMTILGGQITNPDAPPSNPIKP